MRLFSRKGGHEIKALQRFSPSGPKENAHANRNKKEGTTMFAFHYFGWQSAVMRLNISTAPKDIRCGGSLEGGYVCVQIQQLLSCLNAEATQSSPQTNHNLSSLLEGLATDRPISECKYAHRPENEE